MSPSDNNNGSNHVMYSDHGTTAAAAASTGAAEQASKALSECLFSQYAGFATGVIGSTTYSLVKKPKNGIGIMILAGTGGTLLDLLYGWNINCQQHVTNWRQAK